MTADLLLVCTTSTFKGKIDPRVRWLGQNDDYPLASEFWEAHGHALKREVWDQIHDEGFRYCGLIEDEVMAARAAVWPYSQTTWELAAVVTRDGCRQRGYGTAVCSFVTAYILDSGRTATCHTQPDNWTMQRVALSLGYQRASLGLA